MKTSKRFCLVITLLITRLISAQGTGCAGAPSLPVNAACSSTAFTINNNSSGTGASPCIPSINDDAWYQFTAIGSPTTIDISGGTNPVGVVVYSGSCGALTVQGCNYQGTGTASVSVTTVPGQTYYVRIIRTNSGGGSTTGNICLVGPSSLSSCVNSDSGMTTMTNWDDGGNGVELFPETSYGGTNGSNNLGEVDAFVSLNQTVTGLTVGSTCCLSFRYIKRTNCGPLTVSSIVYLNGVSIGTITSSASGGGWTASDMDVFTYCFTATATSATISIGPSAGYTSSCGMLFDDICLATVNPLAVELKDATISCTDNRDIELNWETLTETNNDFFTIQRSTDHITFETIGIVGGAGTTISPKHYTFTDHFPALETTYYRLSQTDYDGREVLLRSLAVHCSAPEDWEVYPNPASDAVNIVGEGIAHSEVELYSINSEIITTNEIIRKISSDHLRIDLSTLSQGVYILKVDGEAKKIIKYPI